MLICCGWIAGRLTFAVPDKRRIHCWCVVIRGVGRKLDTAFQRCVGCAADAGGVRGSPVSAGKLHARILAGGHGWQSARRRVYWLAACVVDTTGDDALQRGSIFGQVPASEHSAFGAGLRFWDARVQSLYAAQVLTRANQSQDTDERALLLIQAESSSECRPVEPV